MVNENTMFAPQAGSPSVELASAIDAEVTIIAVDDVSILPDAPNILTMTDGDSFETVIYQEVDAGTNELRQVTRGVQGTAQSWGAGQEIARLMTAQDIQVLQDNVSGLIDYLNLSLESYDEIELETYEVPAHNEVNFELKGQFGKEVN